MKRGKYHFVYYFSIMKTTIIQGGWETLAIVVDLDEPNSNNKKLDREREIEHDRERNKNWQNWKEREKERNIEEIPREKQT